MISQSFPNPQFRTLCGHVLLNRTPGVRVQPLYFGPSRHTPIFPFPVRAVFLLYFLFSLHSPNGVNTVAIFFLSQGLKKTGIKQTLILHIFFSKPS